MSDFGYKLDNGLFPKISKINCPIILELGVEKGRSTKKFLEICKKNQGTLYSIDINDCSNVSNDQDCASQVAAVATRWPKEAVLSKI